MIRALGIATTACLLLTALALDARGQTLSRSLWAASQSPSLSGFFVATNGNDNNAGTFSAPFATLSKCQSAMQASSTKTCYVRGGTYSSFSYTSCPPFNIPGAVYLDTADSGETWSYYPPDGADSPILNGGSSGYGGFCINSRNGNTSNITVNGFTIENFVSNGVVVDSGGGNYTSGTTVENNVIHDNSQTLSTLNALISILDNSPNTTVKNNYLYDATWPAIGANTMAEGFHPGGSNYPNGGMNNLLIENNIAVKTSTSAADSGAYYLQDVGNGTQPSGGDFSTNILILDNYCDNATVGGGQYGQCIYYDNAASNITAEGNIMVPGEANSCALIHGGENDVFRYNICDVGSNVASIVFVQPNCGGQFNVTTPQTGNLWESNIVVGNSSSTTGGNGYWGQSGNSGCSTNPNPMTIASNLYYNYGGGSIVTTGTDNAGSDSNPTTANPQITCWKANIAGSSPYFLSSMVGVTIPQLWGPNGAINPASLPGSPMTVAPSWLPSC